MKKNVHPNFLIGGTAAGGTSFLTAILIQHPEIYLPRKMRPEPHFFYKSWEYEKKIDYYLTEWFSHIPDGVIAIGERSSSYLFGGEIVAERIAKQYPHMKFIFTLRNPIERTWANYRYTVLQGLEELSFEEALQQESQRIKQESGVWAEIQPHNYTGRGFYGSQLLDYLKFFPKENILTIKSENLSKNTDFELKKIYSFLGLSNLDFNYQLPPNYTSINVVNPLIQKKLREYFQNKFDQIIEAIRKESDILKMAKNKEDEKQIKLLLDNLTSQKMPMPTTAREYLNDLFAKDLKVLSKLIDFEISDWQ